MPLFGASKPSATVSEYARWFHTFNEKSASAGLDPKMIQRAYVKAIIDLVAQQDSRFGRTDLELFVAEFVALRAEIFGIAWGHAFNAKDKHLLGEGKIAKEILTGMGLWDRTDKYNMAAARSGDEALPQNDRLRRGVVTFQNSWRVSMAENWTKLGVDKEVISHVINRIFTQDSWKSGMTLRYILAELIQALGFADASTGDLDLNQEALIALQVPLLDIYVGSRENFAKYNINPD